jgi:hypothetical protein
MRARNLVASLFAILAALALSPAADGAKKKKPKAAPKEAAPPKANTQALTQLMGKYKWGITVEETLEILEGQIADRYAEAIQKASADKYQQNKLRKEIKAEVDKVRKSLLPFEGQKTGWDVSTIEREFGHKNDESMLIYKEFDDSGLDQQRFFFFVDGKLWKMFIAVNMDAFKDKTFDDFRAVMEARYGKAAVHTLPKASGGEEVDYIYWRGNGAYLRAIDLTRFYGTFCIAISDDSVEKTIYERRAMRNPPKPPTGTVVDSVMADPANNQDPTLKEENSDVVDRITKGKKDGEGGE